MANKTKYGIGTEWDTNYGRLKVIDRYRIPKKNNKILIRFLVTGTEKWVTSGDMTQGNIKDPFHTTVYGIGCIGNTMSSYRDENNKTKVKISYSTWHDMLRRCYVDKKSITYFNITTVCSEWFCFETYEKWFDSNEIKGYQVDKDLTVLGNKLYSPDTCCFIPNRINVLISKKDNKNHVYNHLTTGVSFHKRDQVYTSQCYDEDRLVHLGYHDTEKEAFYAYKAYKEPLIKRVAKEYYDLGKINEVIYSNLMNYEVLMDVH
jgi:hypothetical protein